MRSELGMMGQKVGGVMEQSGKQQTFSVKSPIVTILGFAGQMVSDAATRLCCCRVKTPVDGT